MKKITFVKNSILLIVFLTAYAILFAQSPALPFTIGWQKLYGGSNVEENDYLGRTIANAPGGGYFFIGDTKSNDGDVSGNHGKGDVWVVRIDESGNILWQKCVGGNQEEFGEFVISTSDGGCLVGGQSFSNNGDIKGNHGAADAFVVKLSNTGIVEWGKSLGSNKDDHMQDALQNPDRSFILAGYTKGDNGDVSGNHGGQDAWVVKLNSSGNIIWQKCLGGSADEGYDHLTKIIRCKEGGYLLNTLASSVDGDVSGFHRDNGNAIGDAWLVKLDENGNIQWNKCYGSVNWDYFENITQLSSGDYVCSGASHGSGGDIPTINGGTDWWVVKINQTGNLKWSRIYGGLGDEALHGKIIELANGDLIMPSGTRSNDQDCIGTSGLPDVWIVKTDSLGNILSYTLFGGPGYENTAFSVLNSDGSLTVCAMSDPTDFSLYAGAHDANSQLWILHLLPNPADTFAITTTSLSQSSKCAGALPFNLSVSYAKRGTFKGNNIFTAELSDGNGSFASTTVVGSVHSTSSGIINCTIPGNLPAGDHYAIRVRSSNPVYTGITSGHLLSIQPCNVVQSNKSVIKAIDNQYKDFSLHVFPNPVSSSAIISFSIPQRGNVSIYAFDMMGRLIKLIASKYYEAGEQQIQWKRSDLKPGVYLLKMEASGHVITQKILVTK